MKKLLLFILTIVSLLPAQAQKWERIFTGNTMASVQDLLEYYDKGYLLAGRNVRSTGYPDYGYLIKTEINGNKLWAKHIGNGQFDNTADGVDQAPDGGLILCGLTTQFDTGCYDTDPYILKLNACGEKEWCHVYSTPCGMDYAQKVLTVNDGYLMLVGLFGYDHINERIWLFKYNFDGQLLWQNVYAQSDTLILNEFGNNMSIADDSSVFLTGYAFYPYPDTIWPRWMRPYIVKVGFDGTEYWDSPLGIPDSVSGMSSSSIAASNGNIYTTGTNYNGGVPFLIKANAEGVDLQYTTLEKYADGGGGTTITWFEDSTLAISSSLQYSYNPDTTKAFLWKVDTLGNIVKSVHLFSTHWWGYVAPMDALVTYDNKLMLTGTFGKFINGTTIQKMYLWKFNQQMEFDSVYTRPFTYDSLCPHAIASDTIALDCDIVVDVDEPLKHPERSQLKAYPNPATGQITVELPKFLMSEESHGSLTSGHILHQWRQGAVLEVYDSNGMRVLQKDIPAESATMTLDVSQWAGGMYFIRLVRNGKMVGNVKIVVSD